MIEAYYCWIFEVNLFLNLMFVQEKLVEAYASF